MSPSSGVVLEAYFGGLTGLYGASQSYLLAKSRVTETTLIVDIELDSFSPTHCGAAAKTRLPYLLRPQPHSPHR
jgi:hypothetical protein